jgi:hypothetical protein
VGPDGPLGERWFDEQQRMSDAPSGRSSGLPPIKPAGWSTILGSVGGAVGGVIAVLIDERLALGFAATEARLGVALSVGAVLGGVFGRLTRRLFRVLARILFGAILAPALWLLVYAFAIKRFAPHFADILPFGPSVVGALAYGVCVGLIPPLRTRS